MTGAGAFGMGAQVGVDTITAATPLAVLRSGQTPEFLDLLLGFRGGSIGESSMVLIILAGIYLIATKTAQWRLIVSTLVSAAVLQSVLYFAGVTPNMPPQYALFSGSLMYISVWMVTDPVSGPNKKPSQLVYGLIIGTVTILVRNFAGFPEGTSFGILMGNVFASLLDEIFPKPKKKTAKKKAPSKTPAKAEPAAKEATA
jgi:Na+-transporting NADH:ubiquinone oxidoreductase subunit B